MTFEPTKRCKYCQENKYAFSFDYGKCAECKVRFQKQSDRTHYRKHRLRNLLRNAKQRAKIRDREFDLDVHFIRLSDRLDKGFCELTGLPFNLENVEAFAWDSPSLDRINSDCGYTYDNVRFILYGLNAALGSWGEDVLVTMADAMKAKRDAAIT